MTPTELAHATALWVPLLSHYDPGGRRLDVDRTASHARAIGRHVGGVLLAGSTGDGWDMDDDLFDDVLSLAERPDAFDSRTALLFGCLRGTTDDVVRRARRVEAWAARGTAAGTVVGLTVCPPVDAEASQADILGHFMAVIDATDLPIAVYQLPQVTGCALSADTVRALTDTDRVILFKDTSGEDAVAGAGFDDPRVRLLRGAEGGYAEALKPGGLYDGWLLSTANAFAPWLHDILRARDADPDHARTVSQRLENVVDGLFEAAADLPFANAFSNANRAAEHIMAHGQHWRDVPLPVAVGGHALPASLIEHANAAIATLGPIPPMGYIGGGGQ
jgi:4-hydroxy-tetrahydrodipicolinate synthase